MGNLTPFQQQQVAAGCAPALCLWLPGPAACSPDPWCAEGARGPGGCRMRGMFDKMREGLQKVAESRPGGVVTKEDIEAIMSSSKGKPKP